MHSLEHVEQYGINIYTMIACPRRLRDQVRAENVWSLYYYGRSGPIGL